MSDPSNKFPLHVRHFSELLIQLRAELGRDLDLVLILSVIAERHYARMAQPDERTAAGGDPTAATKAQTINALSIALYAKIPRETVRRKVGILVKKGWVSVDERGNLSPSAQVKDDLAHGTTATLRYLGAVDVGGG